MTGLPINNYFSAFKFKWMYENVEQVRNAVDLDQVRMGDASNFMVQP